MEVHLEKIVKEVKYVVLTKQGPAISIGNEVYLNDELIFEDVDPVSVYYDMGVLWAYRKEPGLSIYDLDSKNMTIQKIENFAGSYPFVVEEHREGTVNRYLYLMYDYVFRPERDFKMMKYNIEKCQVEGDQPYLNGYMMRYRFGHHFIEWPSGRNRCIRVIDTRSKAELWRMDVAVGASKNMIVVLDNKMYVRSSTDKDISLDIFDIRSGKMLDTKPLLNENIRLQWPLVFDQSNDSLVMPFAEIDPSTLRANIRMHKYHSFINSAETRYGYSGINCVNDLFHAMSFYRNNPLDNNNAFFELAFFERQTYNQILLDDIEGFTNPIRDLQCIGNKLYLRDTANNLFIYTIHDAS